MFAYQLKRQILAQHYWISCWDDSVIVEIDSAMLPISKVFHGFWVLNMFQRLRGDIRSMGDSQATKGRKGVRTENKERILPREI